MKKLAISLSVLSVAALGACALNAPDRPANTFTSARIAPAPVAYRTGVGTIRSVTASPSYSAAAGGTSATGRPGYPYSRLAIRMDNGQMQYIDTESRDFRTGMRVELLNDRTIRPL